MHTSALGKRDPWQEQKNERPRLERGKKAVGVGWGGDSEEQTPKEICHARRINETESVPGRVPAPGRSCEKPAQKGQRPASQEKITLMGGGSEII